MSTSTTQKRPSPTRTARGGAAQRFLDAARLAGLRAAFGSLDLVAPDVAARWALRLWCTLPSTRGRHRDDRTSRGETSTVPLSGGRSVMVESWGQGDPVYLLHGWGGWRGQLGAFVEPLVAAGNRVVALDAPSHGESGPGALGAGRATAVEFVEALTVVAAEHGEPSAVVAHSLGCTAASLAVVDGLPAGRLALVAPEPEVMARTDAMAALLGYTARTKRRFDALLEDLAGRPLDDFDLTGMRDLPPTLVVHDRADKEVPYADGVRLADAWEEAELFTTDGLGHQRILRDAGVIDHVVEFVSGRGTA
ncbi:alpha/beta fold hydrolase [Tessaracoccus sp. OS52]|uniref:alpha/beta fold hydrolase n=1 Tax=Tessaracoccus sp. OS52 TaxID=2886691 RepID=UPI001D10BB83|nr:alpha/beta fold hydrolase [Tessaracoccus sp. OS52]MCC2593931.1 alpha/beta fold hydrolase [Tessaracoccus sp. OS52]